MMKPFVLLIADTKNDRMPTILTAIFLTHPTHPVDLNPSSGTSTLQDSTLATNCIGPWIPFTRHTSFSLKSAAINAGEILWVGRWWWWRWWSRIELMIMMKKLLGTRGRERVSIGPWNCWPSAAQFPCHHKTPITGYLHSLLSSSC